MPDRPLIRHFNHAQFVAETPMLSPTGDACRYCLERHVYRVDLERRTTIVCSLGRGFGLDHRTWLMDTLGTRYEPLRPTDSFGQTMHGRKTAACHEWWSADAKVCWVDYNRGACECEPRCGAEPTHVWAAQLCHAHCNATGRYWCGDESPYKWGEKPCEVLFCDRLTRRQTLIASLPKPPLPRFPFHLDPHRQFTPGGKYVAYTTTVRGTVDVALAPTGALREER